MFKIHYTLLGEPHKALNFNKKWDIPKGVLNIPLNNYATMAYIYNVLENLINY